MTAAEHLPEQLTEISIELMATEVLQHAVREAIAAYRVALALERRGIPFPTEGLVDDVADVLCTAGVDAELILRLPELDEGVAS